VPGISIHAVDVSRGVVAAGMRVDVLKEDSVLASGSISAKGLLECRELGAVMAPGRYRAVFHIADYYRKEGVELPARPFLDVVHYDFGIDRPDQHYHLPFKCTPWGYSCFRGGA
jgi:5-hydroxyisourate hydrolase